MRSLGNWISADTQSPFYARRVLTVKDALRAATAKVCGLGQFVFWINGKKVGENELDPGWTDYRKIVEYVEFDVTAHLHTGCNVLGLEVGNGWFIKNDEHYTFRMPPFMPPNPNPYQPFANSLVLAMELVLEYEDGTKGMVYADESFRVHRHSVVQSNVFGSETIDGRLAQEGWSDVGFDADIWAPARVLGDEELSLGTMIPQMQPPIKVIRRYEGTYLHTVNGRDIYDLGQNIAGILQFEVKGKRGDVIRVYPAEKLREDGDVDQTAKGWMDIDTVLTYVIGQDDRWETFRMKFTYFAGKVLAVEKSSEGIQLRGLVADAITSAWKASGSFTCDDERYEKIYQMIERSVEANMLSVHTDCPTIERFPWQEANHLMGAAILYMKDGKTLWEKFLLDMRAAQHSAEDCFCDFEGNPFYPGEGLVPSRCPCYIPDVLPVPGLGSFYDIPPWGSSCILSARWHYIFYGDRKIIEDNYEMGLRYLRHLKTKVNAEGFLNHGLGDWGNPRQELARENIETAFLYADAVTLAWFAQILGREQDREDLLRYAEEVKGNYNEKLLVQDEDGRWCYRCWDNQDTLLTTQACQALPLYWGMVPEKKEDDVRACLERLLRKDGAFISGEIGLPYIIQSAADGGMNDLIAELILREEHPSYYAFIKEGMTTLGEYWERNPRSHCHDMMGHIVEWYYNGIAGICPTTPGFRSVLIRPYLPLGMQQFTCQYESSAGPIKVAVRRNGDAVDLEVTVSAAIDCTVDTALLEERGHVEVRQKAV